MLTKSIQRGFKSWSYLEYGMSLQLKNGSVIKFKQCFNWSFLVFPEADKPNQQKKLTMNNSQ